MNIAIIGTGAVGGFYGARLARAGYDVHFLLHSDYSHVAEHGLEIESVDGSFTLSSPNIYCRADDMPQADFVIVGLKTTANHLLPSLLSPLLKPSTVVLLIQNGVGVEDDVQEMLPDVQLLAGLAFICSTKIAPGHILHTSNGSVNIGNYSCRDRSAMDCLMEAFANAGIRTFEVDYAEARWRKAVWNMPFNGLTVVTGLTTDLLLASESGEALVRALMGEVLEAARACGVTAIEDAFVDKMVAMTRRMPSYAPSMMVDWMAHRPMEIDYLYSKPIAMARKAGFAMPRLSVIEAQLRLLEANRNDLYGR